MVVLRILWRDINGRIRSIGAKGVHPFQQYAKSKNPVCQHLQHPPSSSPFRPPATDIHYDTHTTFQQGQPNDKPHPKHVTNKDRKIRPRHSPFPHLQLQQFNFNTNTSPFADIIPTIPTLALDNIPSERASKRANTISETLKFKPFFPFSCYLYTIASCNITFGDNAVFASS